MSHESSSTVAATEGLLEDSKVNGKELGEKDRTLEDEYPASPTIFYFAVKFALGILTLLVVGLVVYFRPLPCDGVCWVPKEDRTCGPTNPRYLFFHRLLPHVGGGPSPNLDDEFLAEVHKLQPRKGFTWISAPSAEISHSSPLQAIEDVHAHVRRTIEQIPWGIATRANHTLFESVLGAIDWAEHFARPQIESISLLRNPRDRLRETFDVTVGRLQEATLKKHLHRSRSNITFEDCVLNPVCRELLGLNLACQTHTRLLCGVDCLVDGQVTNERLELAKKNLQSRYQAVLIAEDPVASGSLLRRLLPTFFEFLPSNFNLPSRTYEYSDAVESAMDEICKYDDELYYEGVQVFRNRLTQCGISDYASEQAAMRKRARTGFSLW